MDVSPSHLSFITFNIELYQPIVRPASTAEKAVAREWLFENHLVTIITPTIEGGILSTVFAGTI
jgi:hypothetical protein